MGSPSKRRDADVASVGPIIKKKKGAGNEAGNNLNSQKKADHCPNSFSVNFKTNLKFNDGQKLTLKNVNNVATIFAGMIQVGEISPKSGKIILECMKKGYIYEGILKVKANKYYGEFRRTG